MALQTATHHHNSVERNTNTANNFRLFSSNSSSRHQPMQVQFHTHKNNKQLRIIWISFTSHKRMLLFILWVRTFDLIIVAYIQIAIARASNFRYRMSVISMVLINCFDANQKLCRKFLQSLIKVVEHSILVTIFISSSQQSIIHFGFQ